jgi:predicted RNA-binding Zn-ribbon protein involved in translation (DUF1610 family)
MSDLPFDPNQKDSAAQTFKCPTCNAQLTYNAQSQQMVCDHCGEKVAITPGSAPAGAAPAGAAPGSAGAPGAIVEHDLAAGLTQPTQKGLGTAVRTSKCQECGATVSYPESATSKSCDFCGSSQVLAQQENRNLIRPESVVPFKVDRAGAAQRFTDWLKGLWFRPSNLKTKATVTEIGGVYVPFWTFDAEVSSRWTADAGYHYNETEEYTETDDQGNTQVKTREVQKTRWEPASGHRTDFFDDILVCASKGLPENLREKFQSFNTQELQPYDPSFLAGWKAEEYSIDLRGASEIAKGKMVATQESRCGGDVPGDTHRDLRVNNAFSKQTYKHVLLPIWMSAYRYNDKIYRFLVNGQTGEVVGTAPYSVPKIIAFVTTLAAIVGLAIYLWRHFHG